LALLGLGVVLFTMVVSDGPSHGVTPLEEGEKANTGEHGLLNQVRRWYQTRLIFLHSANLKKGFFNDRREGDVYIPAPDLEGTDFRNANLQEANFQSGKLQKADLRGAQLQKAILRFAKLQKADLRGANLQEATLGNANLQEANLMEVQNLSVQQLCSVRTLFKAKLSDQHRKGVEQQCLQKWSQFSERPAMVIAP
jgi:uncharacterized protein YjbI with pentapeptide repeats